MNDKHSYRITVVVGHKIQTGYEMRYFLKLRLMSLRVDTNAEQSYLTSRLKEVQNRP